MTDTDSKETAEGAVSTVGSRRRLILWFVLGLAVTVFAAEFAARQLGPSPSARAVLEQHRQGLEDRGDDVSVLFLGDSSNGAAVDPALYRELTDVDAYSLWLPTASAVIVEHLAVDFALADTKPDTVVIGVTARMFNQSVRPARLQFLNELSNSLPWQLRTDPSIFTTMEHRAAGHIALVRYRAGLRRPSDWFGSYQNRGELELTDGGQLTFFFDQTISDIRPTYESGERAALVDYQVSDEEFDDLHLLIDRLMEQRIGVTVVLLPTNQEIYHRFFPNGEADQMAFRNRLRTELADQEIPMIDMTDLGRSPSLFADGNHLNRSGSTRFTELLVERLGSSTDT